MCPVRPVATVSTGISLCALQARSRTDPSRPSASRAMPNTLGARATRLAASAMASAPSAPSVPSARRNQFRAQMARTAVPALQFPWYSCLASRARLRPTPAILRRRGACRARRVISQQRQMRSSAHHARSTRSRRRRARCRARITPRARWASTRRQHQQPSRIAFVRRVSRAHTPT